MKPQDPPRDTKLGVATFETTIADAFVGLTTYRQSYLHAFDMGIRAPDILRYAFGKMPDEERSAFVASLSQSPWALGRVVAIVKAKRNNTPPRFLFYDSSGQEALEALKILDQF